MSSNLSQIPKHPGHPDVPRPSDDDLVELARGVCHAIEACGASSELTHAVTLASDLMAYLQKPHPEPSCATSLTGEAQGSARSDLDDAVSLGHCASSAAHSLAELASRGCDGSAFKALSGMVEAFANAAKDRLRGPIAVASPTE